jgi:hypothetical protein
VVPELGGTTTVVDFSGGGLLLLMQAVKRGITRNAAIKAFMEVPFISLGMAPSFEDTAAWHL